MNLPAERPHKSPPSSSTSPKKVVRSLKERARNALITGTAGGYLGGMLVEGKARVKIPALTRKLFKIKRKTVGIHGARTGALAGALAGAANRGKRSETVDTVATGGDWKFSAYIEDMKFGDLPKDVQADVTRFVDATKATPVVHYGMTVKELLSKADPVNLATARKNLGTLRASRALEEVLGKTKEGSKYVLIMNDRIIDGHHFLAKAERGKVTSSLNVLDLTPARLLTKLGARLSTVTQFEGQRPSRKQAAAIGAAVPVAAGGLILGTRGGRNALRVVLKGLDKNDPRRMRMASLVQKRKQASVARQVTKGVDAARVKLRAEAMPKPKGEPTLGDAVKTVKTRVKRKLVKSVANIGANPAEVQMGALMAFAEGEKKSHWKRNAAIAAGAGVGAVLGARTLPRLIKRGRVLKEGEELAGKVVYTHEGLTTPASVVNIGGRTVRRVLDKKAAGGSKLAKAAVKVDDFLGLPQRHYGVGAGGGRVIEKTKAHGHRMVDKDTYARGNRIHVDSDTLPKDKSKWGGWAEGMAKRTEAVQQKCKRGDLSLIGNNCEHHAREIVGQGRKSYQIRAIGAGLAGGAVAGGAATAHVTRKKQPPAKQLARVVRVIEFGDERQRQRVRELRDKVGLAKDVAGLGAATAVGVGAVKGTRMLRAKLDDPDLKKLLKHGQVAMRNWNRASKATVNATNTVTDAAAPLASVTRGAKGAGKWIKKSARAVGSFLHLAHDARERVMFAKRKNAVPVPAPAPAQAPQRDGLSKARDAALIAGGVTTAATAGVVAHRSGKVAAGLAKRGRVMLRQVPVKKIGENIQNSTRISADVGRAYGKLTEDVRKPKQYVSKVKRAWREGVAAGQAAPVQPWARRAVKVGKALRLLEVGAPMGGGLNRLAACDTASDTFRNQFSAAAASLLLTGVGHLVGSHVGARMRYPVQNALKKKLAPKVGVKWARRVGRVAGHAPENVGAIAGGVAGAVIGGGVRRKAGEFSVGGSRFAVGGGAAKSGRITLFGGREQLKDVDSSGFLDPLDVFVGRKKGYTAQQVKDYHRHKNYVADVQSGKRKGSATSVQSAQDAMKSIRGTPAQASHGQVYRSLLKKGDTVRRVGERGGGLARDAMAHLRGEQRQKDASGRMKKREWEKPWFQRTKNQVVAAAALGGGYALLKKHPRIRARVDRGVRAVQRKANEVVPDLFPGVRPLRKPGQKTAVKVQAQKQAAAQAKVQQTQGAMAQHAQKIAQAAAAVKPQGKPVVKVVGKKAPGAVKKFSVLGSRFTVFEDPLSVGWDIRDARGRSARVFAPDSQSRERRPKKWHEKVENERKLWGGAAAASGLAGVLGAKQLLKGQVTRQVKAGTDVVAKRAARWKAVAKAQRGRLDAAATAKKPRVVVWKPEGLKGAA